MAQHVLTRLRRVTTITAIIALSFTLVPALTATADPAAPGPIATPTSAADAKTAWLAASGQSEALNEQVLQAGVTLDSTAAALLTANDQVTAAGIAVSGAAAATTAAQAVVDGYSAKLASFANASFRGARLSQLSSLLTAHSADDFLDSVTALDRVAGDTTQLLQQAKDAKSAADAAAADLVSKQAAARTAQQTAQTANDAAIAAQTGLAASKSALDAQVATYESLYNQLSEQERQAAMAAEEARLAAAAAAAAEAAPNDPVAAAAAGVTVSRAGSPAAAVAAPAVTAVTSSVSAPNAAAQAAVNAALSKVGAAYVFGSAGPNSFDCSGLTSWAWAQAGVSIPRTSSGQSGLPSVSLDQLQPGDLITYYSPVHHVAMYIGNGQIVHASTSSKPVYVTTIARGGPNPTGHRVY